MDEKLKAFVNRASSAATASTYDGMVSGFCATCRGKTVSPGYSVEDVIRAALQAGETNNLTEARMLILAACTTLESEDGCQFCIGVLKNILSKLPQ
jgi:hypothetical protein